MTRAQFLNDLYHRLEGLTREQAEQHLTYYAEMLADRMEEGMSEEQAVESMEDVDTIARRILEEEGAAPRPPEPPAYPDASRIPGGGGTAAYQGKRRMNWRRPASVLLWCLAILCALWALLRLYIRSSYTEVDFSHAVYDEATETAPEWEETADVAQEHALDGVSTVSVQWLSGTVEVTPCDGDSVSFTSDDGLFGVEWGQGGESLRLSSTGGGHTLYLQIPSGILASLQINASSSNVVIEDVDVGALEVATISGDITAGWINAGTAKISTTSGDIYFDSLTSDRLDIVTSSGDVEGLAAAAQSFRAKSVSGRVALDLQGPGNVTAETTSGNVKLTLADGGEGLPSAISLRTSSGDVELELPEELGFTLSFDTISGDADMGVECTKAGKVYTRGDGVCGINAATTSGDLKVENW